MADVVNIRVSGKWYDLLDKYTQAEVEALLTAAMAWGGIAGTLADQTDLQAALDAKTPLVLPDNTAQYFGTDSDVSAQYNTSSVAFELLSSDAVTITAGGGDLTLQSLGSSENQDRLVADTNSVALYGGGTATLGLTVDASGNVVLPNSVGVGTTSPIGKFVVDAGTGGDISVSEYTTIADDASVSIEAVVDGGTSGVLEVHWGSTGAYLKARIQGSSDAVTLVDNPGGIGSTADTDTKVCLLADGDGTYTLKNRLGAQTSFLLFFRGMQ